MGKSNSKPTITINENIKADNNKNTQENMEFNVKIDLMFFVIIGIVVFLIIKLNKYFKNYVEKKTTITV